MFEALSSAEIDGQHVEFLPARTVLSLLGGGGGAGGASAGGGIGPDVDVVALLASLGL
jgi:hypothetical protein